MKLEFLVLMTALQMAMIGFVSATEDYLWYTSKTRIFLSQDVILTIERNDPYSFIIEVLMP